MSASSVPDRRGSIKRQNAWIPKKWRSEYDRVIAYSALGKSNTWIAEQLGFTPVHVSSIINTPQGQALLTKLQEKLQENIITNIPTTLEYIAQKTAQRLKAVVDNDALFEKNPFAVIDRGLEVVKGLRHLQGGGNGAPPGNVTNIGTVVITPQQHSAILDGLQKIREIKSVSVGDGSP